EYIFRRPKDSKTTKIPRQILTKNVVTVPPHTHFKLQLTSILLSDQDETLLGKQPYYYNNNNHIKVKRRLQNNVAYLRAKVDKEDQIDNLRGRLRILDEVNSLTKWRHKRHEAKHDSKNLSEQTSWRKRIEDSVLRKTIMQAIHQHKTNQKSRFKTLNTRYYRKPSAINELLE